MIREHIPDDIISIVTRIVDERLRYFRKYTGTVRAIMPDGSFKIHSDEFGTDIADPTTWIIAFLGSKNQSSIPVKVGQGIEFEFPSGNPDSIRITNLSPYYYKAFNEGVSKYVIFENSLTQYFLYDGITNNFILKNGILPVEKMVMGETLKSKLSSLIDSINDLIDQINLLTVTPTGLGVPSGTPNNAAAFTMIKTTLTALKISLIQILSIGNKNN